MNELKILKVKDADTGKSKPLHPHLPEPPACVINLRSLAKIQI